MNDDDLPDWNRPLFLCDDCGKYTESLLSHFMAKRCLKAKKAA